MVIYQIFVRSFNCCKQQATEHRHPQVIEHHRPQQRNGLLCAQNKGLSGRYTGPVKYRSSSLQSRFGIVRLFFNSPKNQLIGKHFSSPEESLCITSVYTHWLHLKRRLMRCLVRTGKCVMKIALDVIPTSIQSINEWRVL